MVLLYINACVREDSRTNILAEYILAKYSGNIGKLVLNDEQLLGLDATRLTKRDNLIKSGNFDDPMFKYAKQFAGADIVVVAAPFWDLSFPALLKAYFENINVSGVTFRYSEQGKPESLCQAKRLIYITTSGGKIINDEFGFGYVKALCNTFYGITDVKCFTAQGLDITGSDSVKIIESAKQEIAEQLSGDSDFKF